MPTNAIETMLRRFRESFAGSGLSTEDIEHVYSGWLEYHNSKTFHLSADIRTMALESLSEDRCREIESVKNSNKIHELNADRIWVAILPISDRALQVAVSVKQDRELSHGSRGHILQDRDSIRDIEATILNLPRRMRSSFADVLSETKLDHEYALAAGFAPQSLRLGRYPVDREV